jgi:hypothetical protein
MFRRRCFLLMLALFAATAFFAAAQQPQEDVEPQRARLQAIRKNADEYARLRESWNAFQSQSDKRKDAVKKLDQDLHALNPTRQQRYSKVLVRYADWLDRLKKTDANAFKAIANAPDGAARLALVKDQRDREWMETQPKAIREQWAKLQGEARSKFVAERRQEERTRAQHWLVASRFWKELDNKQPLPARIGDFTYKAKKGAKDKDTGKIKDPVEVNPVKDYVDQYLFPFLTPAEKKQLDDAEGRWPDYPIALVAIASHHPTVLPPRTPTKFKELPDSVQRRFDKKLGGTVKVAKVVAEIKQFEGPSFAHKFAQISLRENILFGKLPDGNEFMACGYKLLTPAMKQFVDKQLLPALNDQSADKRKYDESEGFWPDYPQVIQDLSNKYNLQPPWHIMPDADRFHWDRYRTDRFVAPEPAKNNDKEAE